MDLKNFKIKIMSTEELMQPRYKVIADYPGSIFKKGEILSEDKVFNKVTYYNCGMYPHLFKKPEWWEERDKSEFTEYIKFKDWGKLKITRSEDLTKDSEREPDDIGYNDYWFGSTHISCFSPSTREEYEQYLSLQKLKK